MNTSELSNSVIFPLGEENPCPFFTGQSYLKMLTTAGIPIANVTFEPGCRNYWHKHPGGQILLVTGGRGWYQEEGHAARELHAGDVVEIPCDAKHWHGAAKDSWFVHLAIEVNPGESPAEWLEPVSDEDYEKLK